MKKKWINKHQAEKMNAEHNVQLNVEVNEVDVAVIPDLNVVPNGAHVAEVIEPGIPDLNVELVLNGDPVDEHANGQPLNGQGEGEGEGLEIPIEENPAEGEVLEVPIEAAEGEGLEVPIEENPHIPEAVNQGGALVHVPRRNRSVRAVAINQPWGSTSRDVFRAGMDTNPSVRMTRSADRAIPKTGVVILKAGSSSAKVPPKAPPRAPPKAQPRAPPKAPNARTRSDKHHKKGRNAAEGGKGSVNVSDAFPDVTVGDFSKMVADHLFVMVVPVMKKFVKEMMKKKK